MESKLNTLIKSYGNFSSEIENSANDLEESYSKQPSQQTYNTVYQACIDSLSKLLRHTESLCEETTSLLDMQGESIQVLSDEVSGLLLEVNINRELGCRRLVGDRTVVKQKTVSSNIVVPNSSCVITKVINTSLDITRYDGVGHGAIQSSKVPATKISSITLETPKGIKDTIFKELNNIEFTPNCVSYFWFGDGDKSISGDNAPRIEISTPTLTIPGNKTNKKMTSLNKNNTLTKSRSNTFRQRNSLTIKACAPNDISDDIYTNVISISSCNTIANVADSDGTITEFINDFKSIAAAQSESNNNVLSELQPSRISITPVDSQSNLNYDSSIQNDSAPLKFPTPKSTADANSTSAESMNSGSLQKAVPPPKRRSSEKPLYLYKARVLYAYEKSLEDELTIVEGDIVEIVNEGEDGWFVAKRGDDIGSIPGNYVEKI